MKNRKLGMLLLLALFVAMVLFATGCGGDDAGTDADTP